MKNLSKTLSVSIVLFNRWEVTKRTLQSIADTVPQDWNIFWYIADNGSTDNTKTEALDFLKSLRGSLEFFERLENGIKVIDIANKLMNKVHTEYVLRCDNDLEFQQGWFEDSLTIIDHKDAYNVCFVSPCHHLKNNPDYRPTLVDFDGVKLDMVSARSMNVPGNYFMKTSVWRDIGGFYSPYSLLHCDVHHSVIARQIGYRYGYLWNKSAIHIGEHNLSVEYSQKAIHSRRTDNESYEQICRGNVNGKHPQEVEFAAKMMEFRGGHFKHIVRRDDVNILLLGETGEIVCNEFLSIFNIPRFNGKIYNKEFSSEHYLIEFCKDFDIRYVIPTSFISFTFLQRIQKRLSEVHCESPMTLCSYPVVSVRKFDKTYRANIVSNRMSEVMSLVSFDKDGDVRRVVNHLHFFNHFHKLSQDERCIGPWFVEYGIENGIPFILDRGNYFDDQFNVSCKVGQPQALIAFKCFERDFHTFYHWKYMVDFGESV